MTLTFNQGVQMFSSFIRQWGNSLALRIPRQVCEQFGIKVNMKVDMRVTEESGEIVIRIKKQVATFTTKWQ
jgi:antitoxin component of MazEF toxin-antitoxin module